ncbi:52 kDa repressor of the inhibitor of the protein kinase-like [Diorhabda carinulata]|uniref:52 kDa repressor of the inhibitor of the protein kinase-like n=1 Tax=Diorhabda carinulata TaxID=1163345 RepID=UPI0025A28242|nr:52 kDa repressor of the inhibitor of the protein kinase-like [Diorhabda carinulata]
MAGINKGVQARVLKEYPRASFILCTSHSLNLVVSDGARSSVKSTSLFGVIQQLYTIFAGSTKRYCIVSEHIQSLSLKQVCETRWEARISLIQAIRYQYAEVRQALIELADSVDDPKTVSEAQSLIKHMEDFSFLTCLIVWHDFLFQVNVVSKTLQGKMADLTSAKKLLDNCQEFLSSFREKGLLDAMISVKEIAKELEIEPVFTAERMRKKSKQFSYEGSDEVVPWKSFLREMFSYPLLTV